MSREPNNNTGKSYQWGVRVTWLVTLGTFAAMLYFLPLREPVGKTLMWDWILRLLGAAIGLGGIAHFSLRWVFRRAGAGHADPALHSTRLVTVSSIHQEPVKSEMQKN
jgi:hypothetical protein